MAKEEAPDNPFKEFIMETGVDNIDGPVVIDDTIEDDGDNTGNDSSDDSKKEEDVNKDDNTESKEKVEEGKDLNQDTDDIDTSTNVNVDAEIEKRMKADPDKSKEDIVSEYVAEVKEKNLENFMPLYEGLHKSLGWEVPEKGSLEDTWEGFSKYLGQIISQNSRPQYSSDEVARFDNYVKKGGNPRTFWETTFGQPDYDNMSVESIPEQKSVMEKFFMLKNPNWDQDKRSKRIGQLEETGLLEEDATEALAELKEYSKGSKERLEVVQDEQIESDRKRYSDDLSKIEASINGAEDIAGYQLSPAEKSDFFKYITDRDNEGITDYKKFMIEKGNSIKLAMFAFKGASAEKFTREATTDVSQSVLKSLSRYTADGATAGDSNSSLSSGSGEGDKNLIDEFVI